jgi:type VI secretion system secreted protein Hcp
MALDAFLTVPNLKGSARQKSREGKSHVVSAAHNIEQTETGLVHRPFTVRKPLDQMSPGLGAALTDGKVLGMVTVEHWRMPPTGGPEENYYTVFLGNAKVVGIKQSMPYTKMEATAQLAEYEEVSFAYENISWRYKGADGEQKTGPFTAKEFLANEEAAVVKYLGEKFNKLAKDIGTAVTDAVKAQAKDAAGGAGGAN